MTWEDLTIEQAQNCFEILKEDISDLSKEVRMLSYLTDTSEKEINLMEFDKYEELKKSIDFIFHPIPKGKAKRTFTVKGRKYFANYDVRKVSKGQYNEVMQFSKGNYLVDSLHLLMASIVTPLNRFGWKKEKSKIDFDQLAEDMKQAPFATCYHSAVFFWAVYRKSLKGSRDYLMSEMEKAMPRDQAEQAMTLLMQNLDGSILTSELQVS
jgi:hypothetical protein